MTDRLPDYGAQNERTYLAWVRTVLTFVGCVLLLARTAQPRHPAAAAGLALGGLAVAAGLLGRAGTGYRRRTVALRGGRPVLDPNPALGLTIGVMLLAAAAVVSIAATR